MNQNTSVKQLRAARELSDILGCGLDDTTLKLLMELLELGIQPHALARVVTDLKEQKQRADVAHLNRTRFFRGRWRLPRLKEGAL